MLSRGDLERLSALALEIKKPKIAPVDMDAGAWSQTPDERLAVSVHRCNRGPEMDDDQLVYVGMKSFVRDMLHQHHVLCAPTIASRFYCETLDTMHLPNETHDHVLRNEWKRLPRWYELVTAIVYPKRNDKLVANPYASGTDPKQPGQYNNVFWVNTTNSMSDNVWPLRLLYPSLANDAKYVVLRISKCEPSSKRSRFDALRQCQASLRSREDVHQELAFALHMACIGVGPLVYAAFSFPGKLLNDAYQDGAFGTCIVMQDCGKSVSEWKKERSALQMDQVDALISELMRIFERVSEENIIDFDVKPLNCVVGVDVANGYPHVRLVDFDPAFVWYSPESSHNGRVFAMLLLFCLQIVDFDGMERKRFTTHFVTRVTQHLMRLWINIAGENAQRRNDSRDAWLRALTVGDLKNNRYAEWERNKRGKSSDEKLRIFYASMINDYFVKVQSSSDVRPTRMAIEGLGDDAPAIVVLLKSIIYGTSQEVRKITPNATQEWYALIGHRIGPVPGHDSWNSIFT
jgi:hypothetical protein